MYNMNRVSNSCKIGQKGYDFWGDRIYLGLFFMQNLCKRVFFFFEILHTYRSFAIYCQVL